MNMGLTFFLWVRPRCRYLAWPACFRGCGGYAWPER